MTNEFRQMDTEPVILRKILNTLRGLPTSNVDPNWTHVDDVPVTSTSPGTAGSFAYDGDYLYLAVATDTWRRIPVSDF